MHPLTPGHRSKSYKTAASPPHDRSACPCELSSSPLPPHTPPRPQQQHRPTAALQSPTTTVRPAPTSCIPTCNARPHLLWGALHHHNFFLSLNFSRAGTAVSERASMQKATWEMVVAEDVSRRQDLRSRAPRQTHQAGAPSSSSDSRYSSTSVVLSMLEPRQCPCAVVTQHIISQRSDSVFDTLEANGHKLGCLVCLLYINS